MGLNLVISLVAWIGLNAVAAAALFRAMRGRAGRRTRGLRRRRHAEPVDGYGAMLLSRVLVQTCRVVGATEACVLLDDRRRPGALVPVAVHGLDERVIGHRTPAPSARGVAVPLVRATVGECGYLWAAAGPAAELGYRQLRLLGELAEECARALDDVDDAAQLDHEIARSLVGVAADDDAAAAGRYAALARSVGERLGLDVPALIELDMAARVQHAVPIAPAAAARALPGFEAAGIVLRFARERWDGRGPHGLRGERIPLASRILYVCQAIDAPLDETLRAVQGAGGSEFDPAVVTALSHELLGPVPELGREEAGWADGDRLFAGVPA